MNSEAERRKLSCYWMDKAEESLEAAKLLYSSGHFGFCANRLYYAAFYAVSAVFILRGLTYSKHTAIRGAFHRNLVKSGEIPANFSKLYDRLFYNRQEADYGAFTEFDSDILQNEINPVQEFLGFFRRILEYDPL